MATGWKSDWSLEEGKKRWRYGMDGLRRRENSKKVSSLTMWLADRYGKIGREGKRTIFYIRQKRTMANFFSAWNSALRRNCRWHNTPFADFRRKHHSFYGYPLFISPLPAPWPDHIKRILFKTDCPPCFMPAIVAGLSWLKKVLGK